jgi:hypothetical protein
VALDKDEGVVKPHFAKRYVSCGLRTERDGNLAALTNSLVAALGGCGKIISI